MWQIAKAVLIVLLVDLIVIAWLLGLAAAWITRPEGPQFTDPNAGSTFRIVALGDSYISGEGAREYFEGTDRPGSNSCRRAPTAYPYIVAVRMDASLTFAACSGAVTDEILTKRQQPGSSPEILGGEPQIEVLRRQHDVDAVLISIGGNDAGFGDIGAGCAAGGDCRKNADFWLRSLDGTCIRA